MAATVVLGLYYIRALQMVLSGDNRQVRDRVGYAIFLLSRGEINLDGCDIPVFMNDGIRWH